jgi:hypothetical protein
MQNTRYCSLAIVAWRRPELYAVRIPGFLRGKAALGRTKVTLGKLSLELRFAHSEPNVFKLGLRLSDSNEEARWFKLFERADKVAQTF